MIQRKQTLFLLELIFLSIALLFIPVASVMVNATTDTVQLVPVKSTAYASTAGHLAAIAINFIALILAFASIFLYKKRQLQIKFCYVLVALWTLLTLMIAACPLVAKTNAVIEVHSNYFSCIIGVFAILAAWFAARFIKKDIELLKSADRIR